MSRKTVRVPDISCGHCVKTIERELKEVQGVSSVAASESSKQVTVSWDDEATSWDRIRDLLQEINYPPAD